MGINRLGFAETVQGESEGGGTKEGSLWALDAGALCLPQLKKSVSTIADACARRNAFHVSRDLNGAGPIRFRPSNLRR